MASHVRARKPYTAVTQHEHRPKAHQAHLAVAALAIGGVGAENGAVLGAAVPADSGPLPASGDGLPLLLGPATFGREVWTEAAGVGLRAGAVTGAANYKSVKSILAHSLDSTAAPAGTGYAAAGPGTITSAAPVTTNKESEACYINQLLKNSFSMRLQGMVDGLEAIEQDEAARDLAFEEKLALIVDRQYTWRQNLAFQQRLRRAELRGNACVEDIDYRAQRGIDKTHGAGTGAGVGLGAAARESLHRGPDGLREELPGFGAWRTRRAATDTWCSTAGRPCCSATWPWRARTAAYAICWRGCRARTCWWWTIGRWRR